MSAELGIGVVAFLAFACLLSGFAHGALGFGFPVVATPLVVLVIDIKSAIALLAPVTLVLTVISALRGGALASIVREFWFVPLATALGAWIGTRVLLAAPPEPSCSCSARDPALSEPRSPGPRQERAGAAPRVLSAPPSASSPGVRGGRQRRRARASHLLHAARSPRSEPSCRR